MSTLGRWLLNPETLVATVAHVVGAARKPEAEDRAAPPEQDSGEETSFDLVTFERTVAVLDPHMAAEFLRKLDLMCTVLLDGLRGRDLVVSGACQLADTAHTLAGSAGMFGFLELVRLCRRFEQAVEDNAADLPDATERFCRSIEVAQQEIRSRTETPATGF